MQDFSNLIYNLKKYKIEQATFTAILRALL